MYCTLCGAEIPDGSETCPECGVDLQPEEEGGDYPPSAGTDVPSDQSKASTGVASDQSQSHDRGEKPPSTGGQATGGTEGATQSGGQPGQGQPSESGRGQPAGGQTPPQESQGQPQAGQPGAGESPQGQAAPNQPSQKGHPAGTGGDRPAQGGGAGGQQGAQPGAGQSAGAGERGGAPGQGQSRGAGGGAPTQRQPGGHGGGFDFGALTDRLPLVPAAVGGAVVGILVFGIGIVVGAIMPNGGNTSALDLGARVTMDFHFGTPTHLKPSQLSDFQVADPPNALLGVLYLLPMVLLYQVGKLAVDFGWEGKVTTKDGAISGASVALGYLPIMLIAALLLPEMSDEFSMVTALVLSGLVYPIVFGALGGLSASEFTPGQRRVGTLYGIVGFIAVFVGLFVSSYVFISTNEMIELGTLDRLFATITVLAQTHSLTFAGVGENVNMLIPILLTVLIVGAVGFLRVWRSHNVLSPIEAATRALTPAVAYTFLFGIVGSAALLFADPYVAEKVGVGFLAGMFAEALAAGPMANIGAYVTLVVKTLVVFPVIIGGSGGVFAWWVENRNRQQY